MLLSLSQRARVIVLGVIGAVAAFFLFGGGRRASSSDPFDAVPKDSFLVATMNLAELRRSPLYEILLGRESPTKMPKAEVPVLNARALGIDKLSDACGFDPLARVDQLAVAVPEEGETGELGVAARVTVTRDELSKCTSALADQRGGKVSTKEIGSFAVVEDESRRHESEGSVARPRLAYGHGGLLVAGRGAWFDAMLATADAHKPGAREAPGHVAMRSSLTSKEGWRSPTVLVTALLPRSLRDRIKNEMGAELGSKDNSQSVMAGVLAVSSVGLAVRAGQSGGSIDLAIELACDGSGSAGAGNVEREGEEASAAVEKLILKKRLDWSKELTLRMVGLGPLLDSIDVKRGGGRVRVTAGASADALASTIDRILRLKARKQDDPAPRRDPDDRDRAHDGDRDRDPTRKSDETIPAPRPLPPRP